MLSIKEMHVVDCLFPLSVSVALAVVLAVAILGVLAVLGYCFLKNKRKKPSACGHQQSSSGVQ